MKSHGPDSPRQKVLMVGFREAQILDITGPMQILSAVNDLRPRGNPAYELSLVASMAGPLQTTSGIRLYADKAFVDFEDADLEDLDTLMVSGGEGIRRAMGDRQLIDFLRRAAPFARRVVSICTGTFLLAEAGLASGKRVVTHWNSCDLLARYYPDLVVERDAIYVRDGNLWSSAGVTAGMDLALALIGEDWGRELALRIAQRHVMFLMRPGGQSQFSSHLIAQQRGNGRLGDVLKWIVENPGADMRVERLAEKAAMSERSFARIFRKETGATPARFIERVRTDVARRLLEESTEPVEGVAHACGFGNAERMRRVFHRQLGAGPAAYRERFQRPNPMELEGASP